MRRLALGALAVLLPAGAAFGQQDTTEQIDAIFAELDRADVPGCTAGARRHGETLFEGAWGMGNLELDVPLVPESVFYAGSVSKQFSAGAVALLAVRGEIDLDADIRTWFPELTFEEPISVWNLVYHTSGIRDYFELGALAGHPERAYISNDLTLELVGTQRTLNFPPGDRYMYSNSGYMLLAELVERVTGRSLGEFAADEIFEPLGMARSAFEDDYRTIIPNRTGSYGTRRDGTRFRYLKAFDGVGSGGLMTTVDDLLRWTDNFVEPVVGGQAFLDLLLTRGTLSSGEELDYAFGLSHGEYRGTPTIAHGGALKGFRSALAWLPGKQFAVVVMCNFTAANPTAYGLRIADVLLGSELGDMSEPAPSAAPPAANEADFTPDEEHLGEISGDYYNEELGVTWHLVADGEGLRLLIGARDRGMLTPVGQDRLRSFIGLVVIERDADGIIEGLRLDGSRVRNVRFGRLR